MLRHISFNEAIETIKAYHEGAESYCRSLEHRLAQLINGEGKLTACEIDPDHGCPKCNNRTLVKVPLIDDAGTQFGHRYICQYEQSSGTTIGPCGWIGRDLDFKTKTT